MKAFRIIIIATLFFFFITEVDAQCVMCKATAESAEEAGENAVEGLNTGILYLMGIPYLLMGTIGFVFWKNRKTK